MNGNIPNLLTAALSEGPIEEENCRIAVQVMNEEIKNRIVQIRRGEVPAGYKKIKTIIIPSDWEILPLRSFVSISSGSTPERKTAEYWNGDIPWINTSELSNTNIIKASEYITQAGVEAARLHMYLPGTILMAMYGQGKTRGTVARLGIEATINQACVALEVHERHVVDYVFLQLQHSYHDIRKLSNSGSQENLNSKIIASIKVPLAIREEQIKIAAIFATQDKVIALKEKRIAEKQRQKKYLVQQLLTGKIRISGFIGEWANPKASEVFRNITNKKHNGDFEVLSATQERGVVPRSEVDIDIKYDSASLMGYKKVEKGNFVISLRSFQGGIEYSNYEGLVSPAYTVLTPCVPIADEFYKQFFKSGDYIRRLSVAIYGIRDGKQIGYDDFGRIRIPYPPLEEQRAIANVFNTIDHEIELLQKDLEAEKQKKKALMQLLLTGIVRVKV